MAKVLLELNDDFLKLVDKYARKESRTRSDFTREAVKIYFKEKEKNIKKINFV